MKSRWWIGVLSVAVLALVASAAVPSLKVLGGTGRSSVPVFEVERGEFVRRVWAEGVLEAAEATSLGPPAEVSQPLKIAWLQKDGTRVEAGDVVIRFDPTDMERDLREGRYDRTATESRIEQKKVRDEGSLRNLERDAEMAGHELDYASDFQSKDARIFSRSEIIESEIDRDLAGKRKDHAESSGQIHRRLAGAELDLLAIEKRKADLKIDQASRGLQALEVKAPHDGIFVVKTVWGRTPEVGQMVWGGQAVAELPKLGKMQAKVYVLEADAGGLEVGLSAEIELDAHRGATYGAKVIQADSLAQRRNHRVPVQYFGVTLELEHTDPAVMKPGQRMQSVITIDQRQDVLTVPRQAVFDEEGKRIVYVRRGTGFEPVEVELGPQGLGRVVVEQGLEEGDRVALYDPTRPQDQPDGESGNGESGPVGSAS